LSDLITALAPYYEILIVLVVVIVVVRLVFPTALKRKPRASYPYQQQKTLFTPAERSFLGVLEQAIGNQYTIFGKVRLADVISVERGLSQSARQSAFNKIRSKHLDYVICDPNDLSIQFAIELDDKSHSRPRTMERDEFVDQALRAAEVPLLRFPAKQSYSVQEVRERVENRAATGFSALT